MDTCKDGRCKRILYGEKEFGVRQARKGPRVLYAVTRNKRLGFYTSVQSSWILRKISGLSNAHGSHIDINLPYYGENRASTATWTNFTDYSLAMFDERIWETAASKVLDAKPFALGFRIAPHLEGCPDNGPKFSDLFLSLGGSNPIRCHKVPLR